MIIYWLFFSLPILLSINNIKFYNQKKFNFLLLYSFFCILFIGFRYEVGGDWGNYIALAEQQLIGLDPRLITAPPVNTHSIAYNFLSWVSVNSGLDVLGVNLICALIFIFGIYKICINQPNKWLAYVVAFPFLILVVGMGHPRQACAIGIAFWCFTIWKEHKNYKSIKIFLLSLIALTFHSSSFPLFFLCFIRNKGNLFIIRNILISIPLLLGSFFIIIPIFLPDFYNLINVTINFYLNKTSIYTQDVRSVISKGAQIRMLMNIPVCILFLFFYKNFAKFDDRRLLIIMTILSFGLFAIVQHYTTLIDRLGYYLIAFQIIVYSRIPSFINNKLLRLFFILSVCLVYIFLLFVWFKYSNSSSAWLPYKLNLLQTTFPLAYHWGQLI